MDMKNIPPTPQESQAQATKWSAIARALIWAVLLLAIFMGLVLHLAWSTFQQTAPFLLYCFEACVVILMAGGLYGLFRSQHDMHQAKLERYRHNTYRLAPADFNGNYEVIYDAEAKSLIQPAPGNYQQPVSQTYAPHYAPSISYEYAYKERSQRMIDAPASTSLQASIAPSLEEVVSVLPRNGLQLSLGRSLTTGELLQIALADNHCKIIGATRKGKSSLAAAILEQGCLTHDPNILQYALLDLEWKTARLFERSSHVAFLQAGRRGKAPAIARSADEVALWLRYLREEMDRRYSMTPQQKAQLPYLLIYIEEFLDLRRRLTGTRRAEALDDFTSLATRCLKERMALMVCAQVDYADEDVREAMAQFVGTNVAFSVKPSAARSAGFVCSDLLNKNYATRMPGHYVVEATGFSDLGVAPQYDVRQKLAVLDGMLEGAPSAAPYVPGSQAMPALASPHMQREGAAVRDGIAHPPAPAWQAYYDQVWDLYQEGVTNQAQIIERIWGVSKGGNEKWYTYRDVVQQCLAEIRSSEMESET